MSLPWRERLTMRLVPASLYYHYRIADEALWGEHESNVLGDILRPGGTAIDVGANQGVFSFAFNRVADRVEAFEPNPDYAEFGRRMLGRRARMHHVALSNHIGTAEFVVPLSPEGTAMHLGGHLKAPIPQQVETIRFAVAVRTLDSYAFNDVRVVKIDTEGTEMDGGDRRGRKTIARERPLLIVELLTGTHDDPVALTEEICSTYGYVPMLITQDGDWVGALPIIQGLGSNTTWGSPIRNRNVLFIPNAE